MEFARLEALYWLLAALGLLALTWWRKPKRPVAHANPGLVGLPALRPSHLRLLPKILFLLGLGAAGMALLEPRIRFQEGATQLEGLDIVLVVDLSSSMHEALGSWEQHREIYRAISEGRLGMDSLPETRMDAVKAALLDFVSRRQEDRLALVTFSENSYVVSPFTTDHDYLDKYVRMLNPDILQGEGMTAIGEGVATAIDLMRRQEDPETKNKVIVVFTDGENNHGRNPVEVLGDARFYGYRVYLIGVELARQTTRTLRSRLLIQAIRDSGGQYFDARDKAALQRAYQTIDRIEKAVFVERTLDFDVPAYQVFVFAALIFLFTGLVLNAVPYFVEIG